MKRTVTHVSRGRPLTEEEAAEYRDKVARAEAEKPRILALGRKLIADKKAHAARLQETIARLKAERKAQGLSIAELSRRAGISKPSLSRLENGRTANPTMETLRRYAAAVGRTLVVQIAGNGDE